MKYSIVAGLNTYSSGKISVCDSCILGKQHASNTFGSQLRAVERMKLLHIALRGGISLPKMRGKSYYLIIVNDLTRYIWAYFMRKKDQSVGKFKQWLKLMES